MTEPTSLQVFNGQRGTPKLNAALSKFQAEMPALERDRRVDVETKDPSKAYGYSYATLANVTRHALPLLGKHGLSFTAFPGLGSDGKMALRYALLHESGEERTGEFPLSAEGGIQMLGGRITYIRRYCLLAVTGLAADEDDDAAAAQAEGEANAGKVGRATPAKARTRTSRNETATDNPRPDADTAPTGRAAPPPLPGEDDGPTVPRNMMAKLIICLDEVGIKDRLERLSTIATVIGRPINSANDMDRTEISGVIDAIERAKKGEGPTGVAEADWVSMYQPAAASRPARKSTNAREALGVDHPPSHGQLPQDGEPS